MGEAAKLFNYSEVVTNESTTYDDKKKSIDKIKETYTPELVFVLCGQLGASSSTVSTLLREILIKEFRYEAVEEIKMSKLIIEHKDKIESSLIPVIETDKSKRYNEIKAKIEIGNELRRKFDRSILADLAVKKIAEHRVQQERLKRNITDPEQIINIELLSTDRRVAYIIDSVKNEDELKLLNYIYGNMMYFIGISAPIDMRKANLLNHTDRMSESEIALLIDRDSGEELSHGQAVNKIIPLADFFMTVDPNDHKEITSKLLRFLDLIFNSSIITPTPNETAMYLAASVAGNSACLSRQVGAVVTDAEGEIISVGWNDVPRFGGGLYDGNEKNGIKDSRCMNMEGGICFNDREKDMMINQISDNIEELMIEDSKINELSETLGLDSEKKNALKDFFSSDELRSRIKKNIRNSKLSDIIEFSRAIHAEMTALIIGSQKAGERVKGGKLFCTTYPCHNCGRHIIISGIKEVYYIEPYRKSLTCKLHRDAITENQKDAGKVILVPFEGVGPNKYLQLFDMAPNSRKMAGKLKKCERNIAHPKMSISLSAIPFLEAEIFKRLDQKFVN